MPFFDPGDTLRTAMEPRLDFGFEPDCSSFRFNKKIQEAVL